MAATLFAVATKVCSACRESKPLEAFPRAGNLKDGLHTKCKVCKNARAAGYYRRWTPEQRQLHRARVMRYRYGVEVDLLRSLYEQQEGCCAICGRQGDPPAVHEKNRDRARVLHVDHDHETKEVRGLLCATCNTGLGSFGESADVLVKAAAYLIERGRTT